MSEPHTPSSSPKLVPRRIGRAVARGTGGLLITAGIVLLLFVGYELWFTGLYTAGEQRRLTQRLELTWNSRPPAATVRSIPYPRSDSGFAILRIPSLGKAWKFVVIEGTGTDQLKKGPGHYPGTALPGEVGNFVVRVIAPPTWPPSTTSTGCEQATASTSKQQAGGSSTGCKTFREHRRSRGRSCHRPR